MAVEIKKSVGHLVEALGQGPGAGAEAVAGAAAEAADEVAKAPIAGAGAAAEAVGEAADAVAGEVAKVPIAGAVAAGAIREGGLAVQATEVLVESGIVGPMPPGDLLRAAKLLLDLKMTPAAGFTVASLRYPDQPAIIDEQGVLTYAEVDRRTNALARAFIEEGIGRGDSVAIMCRDHRGFIEATVALSKLGATALFYNTAFAGPQLAEVTKREGPNGIVYDEEFAEVLEGALRGRRGWVGWSDGEETDDQTLEQMIEQGDDAELEPPEEVGKIVLLTSGSTGTPKGAPRSEPSM